MAEILTWVTLARWLETSARFIPNWLLRRFWSAERLLRTIEVFHFNQAPRFDIQPERVSKELSIVGFNVFNFSPFTLAFVGADLRISVNSRELFEYKMRFPSEIPAGPYARSGFHFKIALTDNQAAHIRSCRGDWISIRISGTLIVRSAFGEMRKEIAADVAAVIDR
jgi:hypothetical protein